MSRLYRFQLCVSVKCFSMTSVIVTLTGLYPPGRKVSGAFTSGVLYGLLGTSCFNWWLVGRFLGPSIFLKFL